MDADEETVYNFCTELLTTKQVSDKTFEATKAKFGERGVVDLIGVTATTSWCRCCSTPTAIRFPMASRRS